MLAALWRFFDYAAALQTARNSKQWQTSFEKWAQKRSGGVMCWGAVANKWKGHQMYGEWALVHVLSTIGDIQEGSSVVFSWTRGHKLKLEHLSDVTQQWRHTLLRVHQAASLVFEVCGHEEQCRWPGAKWKVPETWTEHQHETSCTFY